MNVPLQDGNMSWINQLTSQIQNFAHGLDQDGNPTPGNALPSDAPIDVKALLEERSRLQDSLLQLDSQYQEERSEMIFIRDELQAKLQRAEAELNVLRKGGAPAADHEVDLEDNWDDDWGDGGSTKQKLDESSHEVVELQKSLDEAQRQLSSVTELKIEIDSLKHENVLLKNKLDAMQEENEMLENELESRGSAGVPAQAPAEPAAQPGYDYEGFCKDVVSTLLGESDLSAGRIEEAREGLKQLSSKVQRFEERTVSVAESLEQMEDQRKAILAEKSALENELQRLSEVEGELRQVRSQLKKATDDKSSLSTKIERTMRSQAELEAQIAELSKNSETTVDSSRVTELEALLEKERESRRIIESEFESFKDNARAEAEKLVAETKSRAEEALAEMRSEALRSENARQALLEENQNLKLYISELKDQNSGDAAECGRLREQIRNQECGIQELRAELDKSKKELIECQMKIINLEGSPSRGLTPPAEAATAEEIASLKQRLETSEQELDLLRHSRDSVVNELETAENYKQQLLAQITSLQQEAEAMKIVKVSRDQSLEQLANEKKQMLTVLNEKARENAELQSKLGVLMQAISDEKLARTKWEQQLAEYQQRVREEQESSELPPSLLPIMISELKIVDFQISNLENEIQNISRTLAHKNEENNELRQRIQRLLDNETKMKLEIQRLTTHLVEVEETYTREAVSSEQRTKALQQRLTVLEESARSTDSSAQAITAQASQRAEMLEAELVQALSQRDEALDQVSTLEDQIQQSAVSLASLQLVLEHMQTEKDNGTKSMRKHTESELKKLSDRIIELEAALNAKDETLNNMSETVKATSKLSQQLQDKNTALSRIQLKLNEKEQELQRALEKCRKSGGTDDRVDKQLIKNMLLGYFTAAPDKKADVMRCITGYLEFSEDENRRISSSGPRGLFGIFGSSPPASQDANDSFTNQLIAYIEKESTPSTPLKLPTEAASDRLRKVSSSSCPPEHLQRQQSASPFRPDNPLFNHLPTSPIAPSSTSSQASTTSEPEALRELLSQPNAPS
ncbi:thyroid receptor-interacting protein 11 [Galendromus occidentalis]|uniref:Thyroid receptor-interacting protein 11 n=1 Tax=Galendromus occidentalis TaxID=34638 RepID=A0AAJ7SHG7_9ACAR|nr:thyroid receptor-interacting protein 11 [Galendromus occidentalis]